MAIIVAGWVLVLAATAGTLYALTPPAPPPTPVAPVSVGSVGEGAQNGATVQATPLAPATAPTPAIFVAPGAHPAPGNGAPPSGGEMPGSNSAPANNAPGMAPARAQVPTANQGPRIAANLGSSGVMGAGGPLLPSRNPRYAPQPGGSAAQTAFEAAQAALRAGDKEAARAEFERAVQLAPDNLPSRLNLASVYLDLKQPARAVPHLKIVAARDPKNAAVQFTLARALLADKKLDEATPYLQKTVQLAPNEKDARVLLAQVLFDRKKPAEAYAQWTALARQNPKDAGLQLQAASMASDVLKKPAQAEKWLRRALTADPKNPRPALALGQLLLRRKDAKGAAKVLADAARTAPDNFAVYPLLADARTASGDTKGAAAALRSALQKLPAGTTDAERAQLKQTEGALRLALGRTLGADKQPKAARVEFEKAAQLLPRDAEPRALAGVAALQLKDAAGAISNFKSALQIDPKRAQDRLTLAQLLADGKKWKQADAQFALYDGAKPGNANALLQWSQVAGQLKNPARQAMILGRAAKAAPKNVAIWTALGIAQRASGDRRAALAAFGQSAKLRPKDADVMFEMAQLQTELGDNSGAYENYKDVVAARPKAIEAYPALLEAADKAGQNPNARQFLARELAGGDENLAAIKVILGFYQQKQRPTEARAFLNDLVARAPQQEAPRTALNALKGASATPAPTEKPTP